MSNPSKKAARASLILVLGATSAIPAVAAFAGNDQPVAVVASAASADATQQLADQILGRDVGETTSYAREGRDGSENTRRQNRRARQLERRALDAYFDAGYDYDHAVELAEYWGYDDTYTAKITKGKFILGAIEFPPAAGEDPGENPGPDLQQQALDAYFDAGYDYDHAVELAEYWGYDDTYSAKITKGKVLLGAIEFPPAAGEDPGENPGPDLQQQALDAYFDAGYDYDHAVELAEYWGYDDTYSAKITKGKVLLGAIEFPPQVEGSDVAESPAAED